MIFHWFLFTFNDFLLIFYNFHWFSLIFIDFHWFPINFYRFSLIFYWFSLIFFTFPCPRRLQNLALGCPSSKNWFLNKFLIIKSFIFRKPFFREIWRPDSQASRKSPELLTDLYFDMRQATFCHLIFFNLAPGTPGLNSSPDIYMPIRRSYIFCLRFIFYHEG